MLIEKRDDPLASFSASAPEKNEISLVEIANVLLRQRRLIIAIAAAMAFVTIFWQLVAPRKYTVESSFMVQSRDESAAAGLAAQLGVGLTGTDAGQSPAFYASLVKTPDVLDHLLDKPYRTSTDSELRALARVWHISGSTDALTREATLKKLDAAISSSVALKLDLVTLDVATNDPLLSRMIADELLAEINRFNLQTRQSRAANERKFLERRIVEVETELREAALQLQQFLEQNRQTYLSAALGTEKGRLARREDMIATRYVAVTAQYERARMDEARDTPLITIIRRPRTPIRADSRGFVKSTILVIVLGLAFGALMAFIRAALAKVRTSQAPDARELQILLADSAADVGVARDAVRRLAGRLRRPRS